MKLLVLAAMVAVGAAIPNYNPHPPILSKTAVFNPDGSFENKFEAAHGIVQESSGYMKNLGNGNEILTMEGRYSYLDDNGVKYTVTWTADENGFIAKGDHIP